MTYTVFSGTLNSTVPCDTASLIGVNALCIAASMASDTGASDGSPRRLHCRRLLLERESVSVTSQLV